MTVGMFNVPIVTLKHELASISNNFQAVAPLLNTTLIITTVALV